ncbi:MAG: hypothetical protein U5K76_08700 [Woeseiaceae bacterium]|nr:hypothetical protein [Woeseiaceae bacterium]
MNDLRGIGTWRGVPALLAAALVSGCGEPPAPPEEAVRAWIAAAEEAAEREDRATLLAMVSPSYADARGNDRDALDRLFRFWFMRMNNVSLLVGIDEVIVHRASFAEATMTVGLAGTGGGTFGLSADAYRFDIELQADGDEWRLIGARWGELGQELR